MCPLYVLSHYYPDATVELELVVNPTPIPTTEGNDVSIMVSLNSLGGLGETLTVTLDTTGVTAGKIMS